MNSMLHWKEIDFQHLESQAASRDSSALIDHKLFNSTSSLTIVWPQPFLYAFIQTHFAWPIVSDFFAKCWTRVQVHKRRTPVAKCKAEVSKQPTKDRKSISSCKCETCGCVYASKDMLKHMSGIGCTRCLLSIEKSYGLDLYQNASPNVI